MRRPEPEEEAESITPRRYHALGHRAIEKQFVLFIFVGNSAEAAVFFIATLDRLEVMSYEGAVAPRSLREPRGFS